MMNLNRYLQLQYDCLHIFLIEWFYSKDDLRHFYNLIFYERFLNKYFVHGITDYQNLSYGMGWVLTLRGGNRRLGIVSLYKNTNVNFYLPTRLSHPATLKTSSPLFYFCCSEKYQFVTKWVRELYKEHYEFRPALGP